MLRAANRGNLRAEVPVVVAENPTKFDVDPGGDPACPLTTLYSEKVLIIWCAADAGALSAFPYREVDMRRIIETTTVIAAAAVTTVAIPLNAHAAAGVFTVQTQTGTLSSLKDPENGKCYSLPSSAVAYNKTDTRATIYFGEGCLDSGMGTVEPGANFKDQGFFRGVIFGDRTDNNREESSQQEGQAKPGDDREDDSPLHGDIPLRYHDPLEFAND